MHERNHTSTNSDVLFLVALNVTSAFLKTYDDESLDAFESYIDTGC